MDSGVVTSGDDVSGHLRGRPLRYLLTTLLQEAGRPLTISELIAGCEREGVVFDARPSKIISDSLRWERGWGRVARIRRGVYGFHDAPRSTRYWIRQKTAAIRNHLRWQRSERGIAEVPQLSLVPSWWSQVYPQRL